MLATAIVPQRNPSMYAEEYRGCSIRLVFNGSRHAWLTTVVRTGSPREWFRLLEVAGSGDDHAEALRVARQLADTAA